MKVLENEYPDTPFGRLAYELMQNTVTQLKQHIPYGFRLNISDKGLDNLWIYWLSHFRKQDYHSTQHIGYHYVGGEEEAYIKYEYIQDFFEWLKGVDMDDIDKMLSEE